MQNMSIKEFYWRYCISHRWVLAFIDNDMDAILRGEPLKMDYVKYHFAGRWFADPFILDADEKNITLLVEDFDDASQLGKISRLKIDRLSMELKDVKVILSLKTHLSFPNIIRKTDEAGKQHIYIYPENYHGDGLSLYEYLPATEEVKKMKLFTADPLTDADYVEYFGKPQIFSTRVPMENKDVLYIYEQTQGTFAEVAQVKFDECTARNAGGFFMHGDKVYRPAQECNGGFYGHAVSLQRVDLDGTGYRFTELRRIYPPKDGKSIGIHTFNTYKGLTVIDVKQYRHPLVAKSFTFIANLIKKVIR